VPLFRPSFFKPLLLLPPLSCPLLVPLALPLCLLQCACSAVTMSTKKRFLLRPFFLLLLQGPPALSLGLELFELPHALQFPL